MTGILKSINNDVPPYLATLTIVLLIHLNLEVIFPKVFTKTKPLLFTPLSKARAAYKPPIENLPRSNYLNLKN